MPSAPRRIVIAFGRMNPPTTGHKVLVDFMEATARRLNADVRFYPSQSQDPKKNPLPFTEKTRFLKLFFPQLSVNTNTAIRTPIDAFMDVSNAGYTELYVCVGSDRVQDFKKLEQYLVPRDSPKYNASKHIAMNKYTVIAVPGERDPDADDATGMSASKMRGFVIAGNFDAFKQGAPKPVYAKQLWDALRRYMNIR